jgi:hypothetical protein
MSSRNTKTYRTETTDSNTGGAGWEPRVTRVEAGLEGLNKTVGDLAAVVRNQGDQVMAQNTRVENQIQQLTVAVTNAAAPRKTDWNLLISIGFLLLAFSGVLFLPLNQTTQATKEALHELTVEVQRHQQLDNHPVGVALMSRLQGQMDSEIAFMKHDQEVQNSNWESRFKMHDELDEKGFKSLDEKLQREFGLANKALEQRQEWLEKEIAMVNDKMCKRVTGIEGWMERQDTMDLNELRAWRNKANGLSSPGMSVPLQSRDTSIK